MQEHPLGVFSDKIRGGVNHIHIAVFHTPLVYYQGGSDTPCYFTVWAKNPAQLAVINLINSYFVSNGVDNYKKQRQLFVSLI